MSYRAETLAFRVLRCTAKILLAGLCSLCVLSLFCMFYKYTGAHVTNQTMSTDYKWMPNQFIAGAEEGFNWITMNSEGFNNLSERPDHIDVLFMGSSNIEAFNVKKDENVCALLSRKCSDLAFYNIGISGHYLDVCIDNLDSALNEYTPSKYVIIETNDTLLDSERLSRVIEGNRERQVSQEGFISTISRFVPAIKQLYLQIENWRGMTSTQVKDIEQTYANSNQVGELLLKAAKVANDHNVRLIILYHPKTHIDETGTMINTDNRSDEIFKEKCEENGIIFIDMGNDFQSLYKDKHILAHGFANTAVGTGHLNKYGHLIIAERLASVIKEEIK